MSQSYPSSQMQGVFIPDDSTPNDPVQQINFPTPESPDFSNKIRQLLGCPLEEMEPMYSEDFMTIFNGQEAGVPSGQQFVVYEAWMDENGNATRPKNSRVETLLTRRRSHGPMLLSKAVCVKGSLYNPPRVIRREPLLISELESLAFQEKRREYAKKGDAYRERLIAQSKADGWITVVL